MFLNQFVHQFDVSGLRVGGTDTFVDHCFPRIVLVFSLPKTRLVLHLIWGREDKRARELEDIGRSRANRTLKSKVLGFGTPSIEVLFPTLKSAYS